MIPIRGTSDRLELTQFHLRSEVDGVYMGAINLVSLIDRHTYSVMIAVALAGVFEIRISLFGLSRMPYRIVY